MRPTTRKEKEVYALWRKRLPRVNDRQLRWGFTHGDFEPVTVLGKHGGWCTECGQDFKNKDMVVKDGYYVCPHCGARLKITERRDFMKRSLSGFGYFGIVTTCGGWQVVRYFLGHKIATKGRPVSTCWWEVVQIWFDGNGAEVYLQKYRTTCLWYNEHPFNLNSCMTFVKKKNAIPCYIDNIYPVQRFLPEFKKRGIFKLYSDFYPERIFSKVNDPKFETILKTGDMPLIKYALKNNITPDKWTALKICFRNHYKVNDYSTYFDYIDIAHKCGLDIHNAKFTCPADLNKAHDDILDMQERKEHKRQYEESMAYEPKYIKRVGKFFDMQLQRGNMTLSVLRTIKEFRHEGNVLHHCVYRMGYYKKENSLILSAKVDGVSTETIELSLKDFTILQCHGDHNHPSAYHAEIVQFLRDSISTIRQFSRKRPKKTEQYQLASA